MKRPTLFFALIAISLIAAACTIQPTEPPADTSQVDIQKEFDNKIVYTTNTDLDVTPYMQHCQQRGGTFNECGSICAPDTDICAEVCAYTCDLNGEMAGTGGNVAPEDDRETIQETRSEEEESAVQLAREWIVDNSITYQNSEPQDLKWIDTQGSEECQECYILTFKYQAGAKGFGPDVTDSDNEYSDIRYELSRHVEAVVHNGVVVSVITDGQYDEMEQEYVDYETGVEPY